MKHLNNSQPLAVSTVVRPLNASVHITPLGGLSALQFYHQSLNTWMPDHTKAAVYDSDGSQTDGVLRLKADWDIVDPDDQINTSNISPQVFWYVDGTQITATDTTGDYYVSDNILYVRKNYTHLKGGVVDCEVRFTDTRTSTPVVLSDTLSLTAILQSDEQWSLNILSDRTRKHYPLSAAATTYSFEAEARYGATDKTSSVAWFWDYSLDNGKTWKTDMTSQLWYVSGVNASTLIVDMDFIESLMVRCRIGQASGTSTAQPDVPNEATASIAWRWPKIVPTVFCYGGDRVFPETISMTFGLIVQ